jgi:hypothetical protein
VNYYLKTERGLDAGPTDERTATNILKRLRHQGRKMTEIYVLAADGAIDRFQERTRRRLGSNAIASRTWLCEALGDGDWTGGRYIPDPLEAITEMDPPPTAVVLVLQAAEAPEEIVPQLSSMTVVS